jgi:hypothetical protein
MAVIELPVGWVFSAMLFGFCAHVPALAAGRLAPLEERLQRARAARIRRRSRPAR